MPVRSCLATGTQIETITNAQYYYLIIDSKFKYEVSVLMKHVLGSNYV